MVKISGYAAVAAFVGVLGVAGCAGGAGEASMDVGDVAPELSGAFSTVLVKQVSTFRVCRDGPWHELSYESTSEVSSLTEFDRFEVVVGRRRGADLEHVIALSAVIGEDETAGPISAASLMRETRGIYGNQPMMIGSAAVVQLHREAAGRAPMAVVFFETVGVDPVVSNMAGMGAFGCWGAVSRVAVGEDGHGVQAFDQDGRSWIVRIRRL